MTKKRELTERQKALAFDLIQEGVCTGMGTFWDRYDELKELPQDEILRRMARMAAEEAEYDIRIREEL